MKKRKSNQYTVIRALMSTKNRIKSQAASEGLTISEYLDRLSSKLNKDQEQTIIKTKYEKKNFDFRL